MTFSTLSDFQRNLLHRLSQSISLGKSDLEWKIIFDKGRITGIVGIKDRRLMQLFLQASINDINTFVHLGFLLEVSQYNYLVQAVTIQEEVKALTMIDPRSVFVVYGRNEQVRNEFFGFLRALDLKPLEWSELVSSSRATSGSPYIGEILDQAFALAQVVIILFTPDDKAILCKNFRRDRDPLYESILTPQPRPNVIFEAGMALGRSPERTILVQIGETRPISDIVGRYVIRFDGSETKRNELAQALEDKKCLVNRKGHDWLKSDAKFITHCSDDLEV